MGEICMAQPHPQKKKESAIKQEKPSKRSYSRTLANNVPDSSVKSANYLSSFGFAIKLHTIVHLLRKWSWDTEGLKMEQQMFQVCLLADKRLNREFNKQIFGVGS